MIAKKGQMLSPFASAVLVVVVAVRAPPGCYYSQPHIAPPVVRLRCGQALNTFPR